MLSGTQTKPRPKPWSTVIEIDRPHVHLERIAGHLPQRIGGDGEADEQDAAAHRRLPLRRPTTTIATIVPMPRGASTMPVVTTG